MRLLQIDESNRDQHARLTAEDQCYHIYEYTSGQTYAFSDTNNLINNLKKKPTSSEAQLRYKRGAIRSCAGDFTKALNDKWLQVATLVPVPPSKAIGDPDFDNRMEQVARLIRPGQDVRNLVVQRETTIAAHEAGPGERVTVEQLLDLYVIDESLANPEPGVIGILDDVLTAGSHYRAMHIVLQRRFPQARIIGLFVARRVFSNPLEMAQG